MERRILFLQPYKLICYRLEQGGIAFDQQWCIEAEQLPEDLRLYLSGTRHCEFNLLIDLPEEECHLEPLKAVSRRDQKHLIAKMQSKRFDNALLSKPDVMRNGGSVSLSLTGVVRHKICADLLRQLEQTEVCIRAVHSPLTLTPALAGLSDSGKGACLFIIPLKGCYRLVACVNSFVFFNRRIPVSGNTQNSEPGADKKTESNVLTDCLAETLLYLQRQQVAGWATPALIFPAECLPAGSLNEVFKPLTESGQVCDIRSYRPEAIVGQRQICLRQICQGKRRVVKPEEPSRATPAESYSASAMLASVALHCGNGYATKKHRSSYTARKVRNVCAALALCSIGGAVSSAAVARKITLEHDSLVTTYNQSATALQNTSADSDPVYGHSVEAVRQAMVTARLIETGSLYTPMEFLNELAVNVHNMSGVSVRSVQWEVEDLLNDTSLTEVLAGSGEKQRMDVEQVYRATVSGIVEGNPDIALATFESFVSTLRHANADPSVVVVETPFGLGSMEKTTTSSLSGATGKFVLELSTGGAER